MHMQMRSSQSVQACHMRSLIETLTSMEFIILKSF